jgi:hypothetical protein
VCSRRAARTLEGNLCIEFANESIKAGDDSATDLKGFDGVAQHCAVDVDCEELLKQARFHFVNLVYVHLSPIIAMTVANALPDMTT